MRWVSHRGEHLVCLLNRGDARPVEHLQQSDPSRVVQGGGRVGTEERGEASFVGERGRAGPVGELQRGETAMIGSSRTKYPIAASVV